jgi:DNA-binding transcriptional MocR family regulator
VTAPVPKYMQAAAIVRAQVTDGTLQPGQAAPSGAALASLTGFCGLTCRKALQVLVSEGVLVPGPAPSTRLRVKALPGASPVAEGGSHRVSLCGSRRPGTARGVRGCVQFGVGGALAGWWVAAQLARSRRASSAGEPASALKATRARPGSADSSITS